MSYKRKVPVMAGLAVLGTAVGVQLGQSAIAEINPAHFSSPEPRFHADLVPNAGRNWEQVQLAELRQAAASDGYGDGCIRCPEFPVEYVPEPHPAFDGFEDGWSASAAVAEPVEAVFVEAADPERERLERYASFPVNERQARRARQAAEAAIAYQEAEPAALDHPDEPEPEPEPVYEVYAGTR
ncbi:MAG: hypothetical protein ACK40O_05430 [Allosphingosinicella sp.]